MMSLIAINICLQFGHTPGSIHDEMDMEATEDVGCMLYDLEPEFKWAQLTMINNEDEMVLMSYIRTDDNLWIVSEKP